MKSKSALRLPVSWPERITTVIAYVLQLAILIPVIGSALNGQWLVTFTGVVVLALTQLPSIIERQLHIQVPIEFTLVICLFLYASFVLGEVSEFYRRFWWWDLMLHSLSAIVIGLIGFLLIYVFYATKRMQAKPGFVAAMTFCVAVATGTIWELFEFGMDWLFDFNMQKSGLVDTMTDVAVNMLGAVIAAMVGYSYVKGGDSLLADRLIRRFVAQNPRLFDA